MIYLYLSIVALMATSLGMTRYILQLINNDVPKWPLQTLLYTGMGAAAGLAILLRQEPWWAAIVAWLSIALFVMLVLGLAISPLPKLKPNVAVGDVAPGFSLQDSTGQSVSLDDLDRPLLMVFYRGHW